MDTQKYASRPVGTLHRSGGSGRRDGALVRAWWVLPAAAAGLIAAGSAAAGLVVALAAGGLLVCAGALILVAIPVPRPAASWTGQICPILLTDISGFSARSRNDEDRLNLRRIMYDVLQQAFEAARLPWREFHTEDRGDGALIVIPPDAPASAVATHVLGRLATALRQHNQSAGDALRMQLRVALHAGPVIRDAQGMTGNAINQTARLVQAKTLRKHLSQTRADLGVIVSAYIYDNVVRQHGGQPIGAADYRKIRFRAKESVLTAWIHLAGPASLADDQAERVSGRVTVDTPGHRLAGWARTG